MGAWIETSDDAYNIYNPHVAPLVGAWIETEMLLTSLGIPKKSHPSWVRGLKQVGL